jgi:uncharacterized protein (TIGR03067 family)
MRGFLIVLSLAMLAGLVHAADEAAKKDQERMQGEWIMVSGESQGQPFPDRFVKSAKRVVEGDTYTVTAETEDGPYSVKARFKLDPTHKPGHIDATTSADGGESKLVGIYEFKGDELHICMATAEAGRPKEFSSSQGTLVIWKKVKK